MEEAQTLAWTVNTANGWLLAGVVFMVLEAFGIPGIGLLFAGLGAITLGALLHMDVVGAALSTQILIFFVATGVWTALLWKPLKKFRLHKNASEYNNIIGDTAYVGSYGIDKINGGEVTWSGTIMKAKLAKSVTVNHIEAGAAVTIVDLKEATLIVKPKIDE